MCPANSPKPPPRHPSGATEPRLSLDQTPRLRALVEGPDGAEILIELQRLLRRESGRATRYERNLFARIRVGPEAPPEIAVVRDLSRSGVRLELSASAHLDVMQARTVWIEMRLPGSSFVSCEAKLVRIGEQNTKGLELAFAFAESTLQSPEFEALLERLAATPTSVR